MNTEKSLFRRQEQTLNFLRSVLPAPASILDLGTDNPLAMKMREEGYSVVNTSGEDLDLNFEAVQNIEVDIVTAFEIIEHLIAPFNILHATKAKKLIATVPLRLWFAKAYRNKNEVWDRHFHEFEDWQFDWLLEKAGWDIVSREKWISPTKINGIRPLLRNFTPRYYAVYAIRK